MILRLAVALETHPNGLEAIAKKHHLASAIDRDQHTVTIFLACGLLTHLYEIRDAITKKFSNQSPGQRVGLVVSFGTSRANRRSTLKQ